MRFQEKSLQDASFLHDQERRKTPTYPPFSEQGFDKVKSLWKEKGGSSGEGRGNLSEERFPLPSPDSSSLPNLQQNIVNQPRLAKTNGKRAQSHVLDTIYLSQDGGIDDGDVILLTCREMLGQIATDSMILAASRSPPAARPAAISSDLRICGAWARSSGVR